MMRPRNFLFVAATILAAGSLYAEQYPLLDMAADEVIQKYNSSSCEQLWIAKGQPKSERQKKMVKLLREDPQMRERFINKIAAPVVNKMFECAMIP
jgi:replication initiation and membrane attachment protein DnaB